MDDARELVAKLETSQTPVTEGRAVPGVGGRRLPKRARWAVAGEAVLETLIRLCGASAIVFVFGIFFFVVREGAGMLFGKLNLIQFLFSKDWYPTSQSNVRYGVFALIVG